MNDMWISQFTKMQFIREIQWNKHHTRQVNEKKTVDFHKIVVPPHKNAPGRGPPKPVLLARRLQRFGNMLAALGLTYGELTELEDVAPDMMKTSYRSWQERIPSKILLGEECAKIMRDGTQKKQLKKKRIIRKDTANHAILVEHAEEFPLAVGMNGMNVALLSFCRASTWKCPSLFYQVRLEPGEPSPLVVDPPPEMSVEAIYIEGLGLTPIVQDVSCNRDYYFVTGEGEMIECAGLYLASQLEPFERFPEPGEFRQIERLIHTNPDKIPPSRSCMYKACKEFMGRVDDSFRGLFYQSPLRISEAANILHRMLRCQIEALESLGDSASALDTARLIKVLSFVLRETQLSPWNRSLCFYWLFRKARNAQSPFPENTTMRVMGCGDLSGRCVLVSYLPRKYYEKDEYAGELDINVGKKISAKKKKGDVIKEIITQERKRDADAIFKDIRLLDSSQLREILSAIGIPENIKIERWDMTWIIEKVASSAIGMKMFNGVLLPYARKEQGAHKSTSLRMKEDDDKVRRHLENQAPMKAFRGLSLATWNRFRKLLETEPTSTPKLKRVKAMIEETNETLDELANMIESCITRDHRDQESGYRLEFAGPQPRFTDEAMEAIEKKHKQWANVVKTKSIASPPKVKLRLLYWFAEDVDLHRTKEKAWFIMQRPAIYEEEEELIIEEE